MHQSGAIRAVRNLISGKWCDFAQHHKQGIEEEKGEWSIGEDVIVHAIAQTAENYIVAVRTVSGWLKKHAEKQGKGTDHSQRT